MKRKKKLSMGEKIFNSVNVFLMLCLAFIMLYPFWYCIIVSFNDPKDFLMGPLYFWPRKLSLDNFDFVLNSDKFPVAIRNSVLRASLGTVLHCAVTGAAAYGLSRPNLLFRKFYTTFFVITMYFSGGMIPSFLLIRSIGLYDNFLVYIIPTMFSFYNCILFMSYYESIPADLEESALIDGARPLTIFFKIILPISKPIFATVALYNIVAQWNSWMDTVLYTKSGNLATLQSLMTKMLQVAENMKKLIEQMAGTGHGISESLLANVSPTTVRVATMVITTFPIVVVYPFFQKYFVKGIMLGSVKG